MPPQRAYAAAVDDVGAALGAPAEEDAAGVDGRDAMGEALGMAGDPVPMGEALGRADEPVLVGRATALVVSGTTLEGSTATLLAEGTEEEVPDPSPRARIRAAAASAATMTMAWVLPVGRSGCIEASTTNRLSVP